MLDRRDYLLRQLQQFIDAIIQLFTSIQMEEKKYDPEYTGDLYIKYLKQNRDFFLEHSIDTIINFLNEGTSKENALAKTEILAELLFGEGKILNDQKMIQKAILLLEYTLTNSGIFDLDKMNRLKEMKKYV